MTDIETLYDTDFYAWSEKQAGEQRRCSPARVSRSV